MRKMKWVGLCFFSAALACAQSTKDAVNAFRDSLGKGQFVLKNFSGEEKVDANWNATGLELEAPRWRTLGVLVVDSVKLKGQTLTLHCVRHVVVRDKTDKVVLYPQPDNMEIDVNLKGAEPERILPKLETALFYPSIGDALAAVPNDLQNVIPARIDKGPAISTSSVQTLRHACDCAVKDKSECGDSVRTEGTVPPKYVSGRDPEFSDQARKAKLNGHVDVRLRVDEEGHPTDVWVTVPLGLGLDEAAARSVLTYVFKPATCHGTPVKVYLAVEVGFQIY